MSNYISAIFVGFQLFSNQLRIGISAILAKISRNMKNGISAISIFTKANIIMGFQLFIGSFKAVQTVTLVRLGLQKS